MTIEVKVPDIGDFKDVPVIEVHVQAGARVSAEDPLLTLESLALDGTLPAAKLGEAIKKYGIDPDKPNPAKV